MRRADWTPVVLITATVSFTVVAGVLLTSPWLRARFEKGPGPERPRNHLTSQMVVWVGELEPGLTGVLSSVWGQREPDLAHDRTLNRKLALPQEKALAFYDLLLFNTSEEPRTLQLADGALTIQPPDGGPPSSLRDVVALVERGEASVSPALRTVLEGRGTLRASVTIPPGWMADLLVAFADRVDLETAVSVASVDGASFRRRPIARGKLEALIARPNEAGIKDL